MWLFAWLFACNAPRAVEEVSFLQGKWQNTEDEVVTEERWEALPDGSLLGSSRVLVKGMLGFAETLAVVPGDDGLVYVAWPAGQDPVRFPKVDGGPSFVVFRNEAHDFPQQLRYERTDDALEATATGKGDDGQPRTESWKLTLVR